MEEIAGEINRLIKNCKLYKRYLECKNNVESNENLKKLQIKMKELKDVNCKSSNDDLIEEYYELEKIYMSNILVKEYESSKREIYNLLSEISDILSLK